MPVLLVDGITNREGLLRQPEIVGGMGLSADFGLASLLQAFQAKLTQQLQHAKARGILLTLQGPQQALVDEREHPFQERKRQGTCRATDTGGSLDIAALHKHSQALKHLLLWLG